MKNNNTNEEKHKSLVSLCAFCEFYYGLSFRQRIDIDLGIVCISRNSYPKNLMVLSDKELRYRIDSIEKPWWNNMYNDVKSNEQILIILRGRGYNLKDLESLHQLWEKGDLKTIEVMCNTIIKRSRILYNFNIRWIHLFLDYIAQWKKKIFK